MFLNIKKKRGKLCDYILIKKCIKGRIKLKRKSKNMASGK